MRAKRAIVMLALLLVSGTSLAQKGGVRPHSPCKHWRAWLNLMPGTTPPTLHVTATCQFPSAGYSVELVPATASPQAPPIFVLKKIVHKPEGMAAQVITDVPLDYKMETTADYKTVLIKPDRKRIPVETVH